MDGVKVSWTFDAKSGTYLRFQGGKAHNDAALGQVNATNVVVLVVDYVQSDLRSKPHRPDPRHRRGRSCSPAARWSTARGLAMIG